jgi:hypothetical protein
MLIRYGVEIPTGAKMEMTSNMFFFSSFFFHLFFFHLFFFQVILILKIADLHSKILSTQRSLIDFHILPFDNDISHVATIFPLFPDLESMRSK